ncbi:hypothetical protein A7K91_16130 [Paenibacillus oryzae]|uniref:Uncharacterized protein n=1 Tax=Paenibacillus oryzae TaxID=1844972 RepID=A0A1A5YEX7_9BACL|nr:hypothetical protein A7K91_16130 [Paenibacillus oryzae]
MRRGLYVFPYKAGPPGADVARFVRSFIQTGAAGGRCGAVCTFFHTKRGRRGPIRRGLYVFSYKAGPPGADATRFVRFFIQSGAAGGRCGAVCTFFHTKRDRRGPMRRGLYVFSYKAGPPGADVARFVRFFIQIEIAGGRCGAVCTFFHTKRGRRGRCGAVCTFFHTKRGRQRPMRRGLYVFPYKAGPPEADAARFVRFSIQSGAAGGQLREVCMFLRYYSGTTAKEKLFLPT